ncbi:MAG: DUF2238 domain-containing protein [Nanoarchaeota archaeon]
MKKGADRKHSFWMLFLIFLVLVAFYIGLSVKFDDLNVFSKAFMVLVFGWLFYYSYKKSNEQFYLASLIGVGLYVALINSFGTSYTGESPISFNLFLGSWMLFAISLFFTFLAVKWYENSKRKSKFPLILFVFYVLIWIILSINVTHFEDWKLENYLTIPFLVLLFIVYRWFRLSNISYGLIFAYMILHIIGTHYTYSEVPFGYWMSSLFDVSRNHYDRIVHFSFGFLLAYPLREVFFRIGKSRGFFGLYVPVEFVLAFSAIYELLEWLIAVLFGGDLGIAYLGTQGDVWDAQKDMALAGLGAIISMLVVAFVNLSYRGREFWMEIKDSFKVKGAVLGEKAIAKWESKK